MVYLLFLTASNTWLVPETKGAIVQGGYGHTSVYDEITKSIYVHGGYKALPGNKYGLVDDRSLLLGWTHIQPATQVTLKFKPANTPANCSPKGRDSSRPLSQSWLCHLSAVSLGSGSYGVKEAVVTSLVCTKAKQEHGDIPRGKIGKR